MKSGSMNGCTAFARISPSGANVMPERDADGGELHGYVRSPTAGWTEYYRDLMNGNVLEEEESASVFRRRAHGRKPRSSRKDDEIRQSGSDFLRVLCGPCVRLSESSEGSCV